MGEWTDFPLPDGSYSDDTRPWSQQDVVGYLPTLTEMPGTRSRLKLACVPGLKPYAVVGDGPHRGARDVEGRSFVVSGNRLYRVTAAGVSIPIGTIPGTGFVSMTHNQIAGGNELVIGTRDNSYVYNTVTDTLTATGVGLSSVDFLGQMILGLSTDRRFWRHSALADAMTYSDLDVYPAESAPDRLVGGVASQSEWLAFGERTIETFVNSPTENASFQRMSGAVVEKGCANGNTIRRLDNSVFWLGDDLIVYRMQGYQPVPVSTKAMAAAFRACDPAKAFAFTYEDHGYVIYYLTFQDGQTWGYDVTNQRWHRRESFGLDRWRLNTLFKSNGEWYGGDYSSGNLYKLEWGYMFEGESAPIPRRIRSGVMHNNGNRVFVHGLKLLIDSGQAASTGVDFPAQPPSPTITGDAPDGYVGVAYAPFQYTIGGGTGDLVVTIRTGSLPPGFALSSSGLLTGTASPPVMSYPFTVRVTDANGLWSEVADSIAVGYAPPSLLTGSFRYDGGPTSLTKGAPMPASGVLAASLNGSYAAFGSVASPFLSIAKYNGTSYTLLPTIANPPTNPPTDAAFSPDGNWLAVASKSGTTGTLRLYKRNGDTFTLSDTKTGYESAGVAWSDDGLRLAWVMREFAPYFGVSVHEFDPETGTLSEAKYGDTSGFTGGSYIRWDHAGRFVAIGGTIALTVYDTATTPLCNRVASYVFSAGARPSAINGAHWSPDGSVIYTVSSSSTGGAYIGSYSFDGEILTPLAPPADQPVTTCHDSDLAPDETHLAVAIGAAPGFLVYELDGGSMTLIDPQPDTGIGGSSQVVWSRIPQS